MNEVTLPSALKVYERHSGAPNTTCTSSVPSTAGKIPISYLHGSRHVYNTQSYCVKR